MSDPSPPCRLEPTRLLCPWDSPVKNTGVYCHALLHGIFPTQGIKPTSLMAPALAGRFFTTSPTWEAPQSIAIHKLRWRNEWLTHHSHACPWSFRHIISSVSPVLPPHSGPFACFSHVSNTLSPLSPLPSLFSISAYTKIPLGILSSSFRPSQFLPLYIPTILP